MRLYVFDVIESIKSNDSGIKSILLQETEVIKELKVLCLNMGRIFSRHWIKIQESTKVTWV